MAAVLEGLQLNLCKDSFSTAVVETLYYTVLDLFLCSLAFAGQQLQGMKRALQNP